MAPKGSVSPSTPLSRQTVSQKSQKSGGIPGPNYSYNSLGYPAIAPAYTVSETEAVPIEDLWEQSEQQTGERAS